MANYDKTKFFWLQLKEDFFDEDAIDWLEDQPNGKEYSLFYLKLCLKSLRTNGVLIRQVGDMLLPYDYVKLGELTKTNPDTVMVAMNLLLQIGLVKTLENGELYLTQVENMIGSQSKGAFKKQQQRISKSMNFIERGQKTDKCPPNIEIELEKEIEIELKLDYLNNMSSKFDEIINYLNLKCKTNYKTSSKKTQNLIKARLKEGFTVEDFKKVIDIKVADWLGNKDMEQYLRPETLFGTKFESYLNKPLSLVNRDEKLEEGNEELKELLASIEVVK